MSASAPELKYYAAMSPVLLFGISWREVEMKRAVFFVLAVHLFLAWSPPTAPAEEKARIFRGAQATGAVFGRVHANMGVLAAVVTFCENASTKLAPFFKQLKPTMLNEYSVASGILIGVHRELMEKRIGKALATNINELAKQGRKAAYFMIKQQFEELPPTELEGVCQNFRTQIEAGEWDVFPLADQYFLSLKPYVPDFYESNKDAWQIIKSLRKE